MFLLAKKKEFICINVSQVLQFVADEYKINVQGCAIEYDSQRTRSLIRKNIHE